MAPSRKPAKSAPLPTADEEARRTNVLLEAIQKDIKLIAETVRSHTLKFQILEGKLTTADTKLEAIDLIKSVAKRNADELDRIASELSTLKSLWVDHSRRFDGLDAQMKMLRDDVKNFARRLEAVESRPA